MCDSAEETDEFEYAANTPSTSKLITSKKDSGRKGKSQRETPLENMHNENGCEAVAIERNQEMRYAEWFTPQGHHQTFNFEALHGCNPAYHALFI